MRMENEEKKEGEKKEEEKKTPVTIISRDIMDTYPKLRELHRTVAVTYKTPEVGPRTIFIDLYELFGEKQDDAIMAILEKKGDLWQKYLEEEKKRIKEDLEKLKAQRVETYEV